MPRNTRTPHCPSEDVLAKDMDVAVGEEFSLESLTPKERAEAARLTQVASAVILKALLYRIDPATYPVSGDVDDPVVKAVSTANLSDRALRHIAPRLRAMRQRPDALRTMLGGADLSLDDFKRPTLASAVPELRDVRRYVPVDPGTEERLPRDRNRRTEPRNAANYRRAHLILRAIHCVRETQPAGWDSIILGGVLIGSSGNVKAIKAFDTGDYRTGMYASFGELFLGQYSLRSTDGYPKHLYAIFKLVESDSDDAEVAQELTNVISMLASTIITMVIGPATGAAIGGVLGVIGGLISNLIDEDELRPWGIRFRMDGPNPFGDADGPKQRTGNITGHGGIYRIGYRWVLGA
ncbi:MAG: hypothetical protein ACRC2H_03745 [Silanimonas sp.]